MVEFLRLWPKRLSFIGKLHNFSYKLLQEKLYQKIYFFTPNDFFELLLLVIRLLLESDIGKIYRVISHLYIASQAFCVCLYYTHWGYNISQIYMATPLNYDTSVRYTEFCAICDVSRIVRCTWDSHYFVDWSYASNSFGHIGVRVSARKSIRTYLNVLVTSISMTCEICIKHFPYFNGPNCEGYYC